MADHDFIIKMVEETMEASKYSHNTELLPFSAPNTAHSVKAHYDPRKLCYVIYGKDKNLEIPKNWGPFANRISKEFLINSTDDPHYFIPVLEEFLGQKILTVHIVITLESADTSNQAA